MDLYTKESIFDANMFELFNVTDLLSTKTKDIEKVQHVRHACNNSHVLMYPMLCNCICTVTAHYIMKHII